ncbi:hypothetical protein RHSIM_Rhsim05G0055300 [Rhododendron simsii]|uniref:Uncharacterized protein n=1 Tax=Rhododendron simsii TaxID=118357 RepID=A0A834LNQ9_RHOSS|nr:hypothetical protein RHSIM_Rhsim05G0055300 [Rhododendron simsii]
MAKEQADRAEPPPPSVVNDSNKSRGSAEHLDLTMRRSHFGVVDLLGSPRRLGQPLASGCRPSIAANRYDANATEVAVIGAVTLVRATCVAIIETFDIWEP